MKEDIIQTGSRLALFIGQIIIIILCVGYMEYIYDTNILPDKEAKETFEETSCYIMSKKLSTKGHIIHSYRADFLVSYKVPNGVQYTHWVSGNGLDISFTGNSGSQEDILSQYDVGTSYTCFYNPNNPQIALLVIRHNWLSTFPLMVPAAIIVIMIYYIFKSLFQFLGFARIKTRDVIRKKKQKKASKPKL